MGLHAFPSKMPKGPGDRGFKWSPGLTKREYFAAMAMQGLLSDHEVDGLPFTISAQAVKMADALLAHLENTSTDLARAPDPKPNINSYTEGARAEILGGADA